MRYVNMIKKPFVVGANSLAGVDAVEAFLDAVWEIDCAPRRKPELLSGRHSKFVSVDMHDGNEAPEELVRLSDFSHVTHTEIYEHADYLISGSSTADQPEINNAMLHNVIEALIFGEPTLKQVAILKGAEACSRTGLRKGPARQSRKFLRPARLCSRHGRGTPNLLHGVADPTRHRRDSRSSQHPAGHRRLWHH